MSKGSDINVGSIEEDIKILQELMEDVELTFAGWVDILNEREKKALKNLIQDYTRQKQINEEHQRINGELREKVKELEEENRIFALEGSKIRLSLYIKENYIPIQKIQDKIEELDRKIRYEKNERVLIYLHKQKKVLQELLQESEDK